MKKFFLFLIPVIVLIYWYIVSEKCTIDRLRRDLKLLEPDLNFIVVENKINGVTFTLAKSIIYICPNTKEYNTLLYVGIHELAHVKNKSYGHGHDFVKTFFGLLHKAENLGIYKKTDYTITPKKYCGMTIDSF